VDSYKAVIDIAVLCASSEGALAMAGSQRLALDVQHDDLDDVLRSFHEWMVQKAMTDKTRMVSSGVAPRVASPGPSVVPNQRAMSREISSNKPPVRRRMLRAFIYGFGVAALVAIAWLAYQDDETKAIITDWERSSLTWLSSMSRQKSSFAQHVATAPDQVAAVAQSGPAPVDADVSRAVEQQLQAAMNDLAIVRHTVEQIGSKQEKMAQDIVTLQAAERDVAQKMISLLAQVAASTRKNSPKAVRPEPARQPASAPIPVSPPLPRSPPPAQ
jgi:hypothetical protein